MRCQPCHGDRADSLLVQWHPKMELRVGDREQVVSLLTMFQFEFPKIGHGFPSFLVFGFHGLPGWRNPWKLKCQSTDVTKKRTKAMLGT